MRILLSYSKFHFDPITKKPLKSMHSASILAKELYTILSKICPVTYIDSNEYRRLKGQEFDLFIGIENNFYQITKLLKIKKSVLFAVNTHPIERKIKVNSFLIRNYIPSSAKSLRDKSGFIDTTLAVLAADNILVVGNIKTLNSYLKFGVKKNNIISLNYGVGIGKEKKKQEFSKNKSFVYASSEIGLRKGFDIIYSTFTNKKLRSKNFTLHIVGQVANPYYEQKLVSLKKILGKKLIYHGWIESNSKLYSKILHTSDFLVYPSLEEGQAGTVLEGLREGVIPIISNNTGIDFSPLGIFETKINSSKNVDLILKAVSLGEQETLILSKKTHEFYRNFHENFSSALENVLYRIINPPLFPKVSIVTPIFNKEDTIVPLLNCLNKACVLYGNIELLIIFDGCKDKTEQKVRDYFLTKNQYTVRFFTAPNIFEIRSDNIALKQATGKYSVLIQDDNYVYDKNIFFEATSFLEKNPKAAVLGALAGVNFYPRGTKNLSGAGQISLGEQEVYWRQDEKTDPSLKKKFFEVDAAMRGPLFIRQSFLRDHGYLDEIYAPQYDDDMDLCYRTRKFGFKTYAFLSKVKNISLSTIRYTKTEIRWIDRVIKRSTDIFYSRWKPTRTKDYYWISRTEYLNSNYLNELTGILIQKFFTRLLPMAIWYGKHT